LVSDASAEQTRSVQFGIDAKKLIAQWLDIALHYVHNYIGTEHLLLSAATEGPVKAELDALGLASAQLRPEIERQLSAAQAVKQSKPN
jgi:ATP-dependent Clp protease ATP-binding subunit ClpA